MLRSVKTRRDSAIRKYTSFLFEYFPEGKRNGTGLHTHRGHLVNQRRELVIIVLVDQHDLKLYRMENSDHQACVGEVVFGG